jgi:Flp pilus assembly protein TadD
MYALLLAVALNLPAPIGDMPAAPPTTPVTVPVPAAPEAVMALPPQLRQRLHDEVLAKPSTPQERLDRLVHFMLDADGLGIAYEEGATYSVEQTYATRTANCLSFTMLFVVLAREAGLDVQPQEIAETISWRQEAGMIYRNNHVNASVRANGRSFTVDTAGDKLIARDRPAPIDDRRLLAHYYNNLAMQQLALGTTANGLVLMQRALDADPAYAALWSNAGVLRLHDGDVAGAERAYQKALELNPEEDSALFNMVSLAHRVGDAQREAEFRRRLAKVQQKDPLHHFLQAMDFERNGDYAQAIAHYRRAIRLHAGEHRFYSALARVYLKAGNPRRAGKALLRAQALSDGATRAAYRAQLQELQRASN